LPAARTEATRDAGATAPAGVLRRHVPGEALPVSYVELFFDLVYVFAVTELSHTLHEHLTGRGGVETLVLFLAV
jgi:low temperature requirement protein LtrA